MDIKSNIKIFNKIMNVPAGVYFSGDFSITAWICLKLCG